MRNSYRDLSQHFKNEEVTLLTPAASHTTQTTHGYYPLGSHLLPTFMRCFFCLKIMTLVCSLSVKKDITLQASRPVPTSLCWHLPPPHIINNFYL